MEVALSETITADLQLKLRENDHLRSIARSLIWRRADEGLIAAMRALNAQVATPATEALLQAAVRNKNRQDYIAAHNAWVRDLTNQCSALTNDALSRAAIALGAIHAMPVTAADRQALALSCTAVQEVVLRSNRDFRQLVWGRDRQSSLVETVTFGGHPDWKNQHCTHCGGYRYGIGSQCPNQRNVARSYPLGDFVA